MLFPFRAREVGSIRRVRLPANRSHPFQNLAVDLCRRRVDSGVAKRDTAEEPERERRVCVGKLEERASEQADVERDEPEKPESG